MTADDFRQRVIETGCVIVGAGPAGLMLGLLLARLVILTLVTATFLLATGYALPFILSFGAGVLAFLALLLAWAKGGRDLIGAAEVREISQYALRQLSVAKDFVAGRRAAWIRSERDR